MSEPVDTQPYERGERPTPPARVCPKYLTRTTVSGQWRVGCTLEANHADRHHTIDGVTWPDEQDPNMRRWCNRCATTRHSDCRPHGCDAGREEEP